MFSRLQKLFHGNGKRIHTKEGHARIKPKKNRKKNKKQAEKSSGNGTAVKDGITGGKFKEKSTLDNSSPRTTGQGAQTLAREEDEFRRNDIDGFDLVPIISIAASTENIIQDGEQPNQTDLTSTDDKDEPDSCFDDVKIDPIIDQAVAEDDDIDSENLSVTDLTTSDTLYEQTKAMENSAVSNLSIDEKETLDMFDSIVNDAMGGEEMDEDYSEEEGNNSEDETDEQSVEHYPEVTSVLVTVESRQEKQIDYSEVMGKNTEEFTNTRRKPENWKMINSNLTREKSWRIIPKADIYLPSPPPNRAEHTVEVKTPELPPADYPDSDDDGLKDNDSTDHKTDESHDKDVKKPAEIVTSFSSLPMSTKEPAKSPSKTSDSPSETDILPKQDNSRGTEKHTGSNSSHSSASIPSASSTKNTLRSSEDDGSKQNKPARSTPRRPRPRVTSFKSSTLPQKLSKEPVNNLVKKFETLGGESVQF